MNKSEILALEPQFGSKKTVFFKKNYKFHQKKGNPDPEKKRSKDLRLR